MNLASGNMLILAADWWEVAAGLIFFILYGVGQLIAGRDEAKRKKEQPRPPRPRPPQAGQAEAQAQPPNQADPLRREVEEFLRRAQGKQVESPSPRQLKPAPTKRQRPQRSLQAEPPKRPKLTERTELRSEGVAEHVARHLSTEQISEHTSHLGETVAQADDRLEAHLQEKFTHQIGSLKSRDPVAEETVQQATIAEEIKRLMSQPTGMRQLIVASEILRRPEERW